MKNPMIKSLIAAVAAIWAFPCVTRGDSTAILDYRERPAYISDGTAGWSFSPRGNLLVTALGCSTNSLNSVPLEPSPDGRKLELLVGLWDSSGSLLASCIVHRDPAASGWIDGKFKFESIAATSLAAGQTYLIGCSIPAGQMTVAPSGLFNGQTAETVTDSAITLVGTAFEYGGFTFPQKGNPDGGAYIGPNFGFTVIPEPRAWALIVFGGAAVAACCHRRSAQPQHAADASQPFRSPRTRVSAGSHR